MRGSSMIAVLVFFLLPAQTNRTPVAARAAEVRSEVDAGPTNDVVSMAISPDGRKLVYVAAAGNLHQLWLRSLDSDRVQPLPGTEGATLPFPFWSPDSKSIGFFSDGELKRLDLDSLKIRTLVPYAHWGRGGTWGPDDTILYSRLGGYVIYKVSANGGELEPVTQLVPPQELVHEYPEFLPDGRHFLYYVDGLPGARGIYAASMNGRENKRLVDSEAAGSFAAGRLLFVNHGALYSQAFDPVRLLLSGSPSRLADNVPVNALRAAVSTSNGHIAYRIGSAGNMQQVTWFDRKGTRLETVGAPFIAGGAPPSLSPDRHTLILQRSTDGNLDLWMLDMSQGVFSRFTSDESRENFPVWSPNGRRVAFSSNRNEYSELYEKPVEVTAAETLILTEPNLRHPMDWSHDGRYLLYRTGRPDLWALQMNGLVEIPIIESPPEAELRWPQFSPDGKWIAFESNKSSDKPGRIEIHIHGPFEPPALGQTSAPISINGGVWARWRADGKELYYLAPDGMLMAVPIELDSGGKNFKAGTPIQLFAPPVIGWESSNFAQQYVVSDDGQRILVIASPNAESPIKVILNWKP
jgi:Tol biopolymer transport system component